jgi:hypothetical protein
MRGFRLLGIVTQVSVHQYLDDDLLYFAPSEDGTDMRVDAAGNPRGIRARDFDLFKCQTYAVTGQCPSDYVFVATAIGEYAFDDSKCAFLKAAIQS